MKCWYCGIEGFAMTKDHFFPKSLKGRLIVRCCHNCNGLKKNKTPIQWIEWIEKSDHPYKKRMLVSTISLALKSEMAFKNGIRQEIIIDDYKDVLKKLLKNG